MSGAILAAYELLFCIHVDILIARGSVEVRSVVSFYHGDVFVLECNNAYISFFRFPYWQDHSLLRSSNFATMATSRDDFCLFD